MCGGRVAFDLPLFILLPPGVLQKCLVAQNGVRVAAEARGTCVSPPPPRLFLSLHARANRPRPCWGWRLSSGLAVPRVRPVSHRHPHGRSSQCPRSGLGRSRCLPLGREPGALQNSGPATRLLPAGETGEPVREGRLLCVNLSFQKRIRLGLHGRRAAADEADQGAGSRLVPCPRGSGTRCLLVTGENVGKPPALPVWGL